MSWMETIKEKAQAWQERALRERQARARAKEWVQEGVQIWKRSPESVWEDWAKEPEMMRIAGGDWLIEVVKVEKAGAHRETWRARAIKEALELGADAWKRDEQGRSALMIAAENHLIEACIALAKSSDLTARCPKGSTALGKLLQSRGWSGADARELKAIVELAQGGAGAIADGKGLTPLMRVAKMEWAAGVEALLDLSRMEAEDPAGLTALDMWSQGGAYETPRRVEILRRLMDKARPEERESRAWHAMLVVGSLAAAIELGRWASPVEWRKGTSPLAKALEDDTPAELIEWMVAKAKEDDKLWVELAVEKGKACQKHPGWSGDGLTVAEGWLRRWEERSQMEAVAGKGISTAAVREKRRL